MFKKTIYLTLMLGLLYTANITAYAEETENVETDAVETSFESISIEEKQYIVEQNNYLQVQDESFDEEENTESSKESVNEITIEIQNQTVPEYTEQKVAEISAPTIALASIVPEAPREVASVTELPTDVQQYCEIAAAEFSIDANILKALVYTESHGNYAAKKGSFIGLTQLNPSFFTAAIKELNITNPYDPYQNVRICAYSLATWMTKYNNTALALDCWHKGEKGAVSTHKANGTNYSRTIIQNAQLLAAV